MKTRRTVPLLGGLSLLALFSACQDEITAPQREHEPAQVRGLVEVTISGIGSPEMSTAASVPVLRGGASYSLSAPANGDATGDGSIQLVPLSTGSFTEGVRGAGGVRHVYASFRVRNADVGGNAYDTPRQNLTFFAAATARTMGGSAVSSLRRFDGSAADDSIARAVMPTGAVYRTVDGAVATTGPDVLQVITEAEVADLAAPAGTNVLPYGFVVRNPSTPSSRVLPASPAPGQYDGVVTFAFEIPLQANSVEDPFEVSVMMFAQDDDEVRVTRSLEERNGGEAVFEQRATALGATSVTLLGEGGYTGAASVRTICSVRIAGLPGSPTAMLTPAELCTASGMSITWTGAASGLWSEANNWSPSVLPMVNDTVLIGDVARQPSLTAADRAIHTLVISDTAGAVLDLGGHTLTVRGDLISTGGSVSNGTTLMSGGGALLQGTVDVLEVRGGVSLQGSTTTTGAVSVRGSLSTNGQVLTISLP